MPNKLLRGPQYCATKAEGSTADNKVLQVVTDAEERGGQRVHTPEPVFQVIVRIKGK